MRLALAIAALNALGACAAMFASPGVAQDLDRVEAVHVVRFEPFSPFERVTWELKPRGRSGVLALTRRSSLGIYDETLVDLIDPAELAALLDEALRVCPAGSEDIELPPASGDVGWTAVVVVHSDASEHVVVSADPADAAVAACVDFMRATILPQVEVPRLRNPFWQPGEFGTLRLGANEVARIFVDGVDIEATTPLEDFPLEPGEHAIRWESLDGLRAKETVVRITAGTISRVDVELDPIE
jgi:hypothetical protein